MNTRHSKKSPSREKYEQNHPTVSARLPKDVRDKLLMNLKKLGMSVAEALLVLAGELEIKVIPIDEARQAGYEEAKKTYMVTYPCRICGKPLAITSQQAKDAASKYMTEHGWGHSECHKKRSPQK